MEQTLTVYQPRPQLTPAVWDMIERVAPAMWQARLFGVSSKEQAAAIMLKGYELGLSLTASFEFVQVVEGRPAISPRGALALILGSPLCADVQITETPDACTVYMKRANGFEYTITWTMDDARKAGVVKPGSGWEKYPANMLRWRAMGFCADVVFPDVIGGMKSTDELGADLTPEGDTVTATWRTLEQPASAPTPAPAPTVRPQVQAPVVTLDSLLEHWTAEQILVANEGKLPGTDDELAEVARKLEAA